MYKVFVNRRVIILTSEPHSDIKFPQLLLKNTNLEEIIKFIKKHKKLYLFHKNEKKLISKFKKKIKVVKAGGGIVKNSKNQILFIYRRNKWDLPKGKKDKGETIDSTALREVREETGVESLMIETFYKKTFHIFKKGKNYFLKETSWFKMNTNYSGELNPEFGEDISKAEWKYENEIKDLKNTFPNIKLLLGI